MGTRPKELKGIFWYPLGNSFPFVPVWQALQSRSRSLRSNDVVVEVLADSEAIFSNALDRI